MERKLFRPIVVKPQDSKVKEELEVEKRRIPVKKKKLDLPYTPQSNNGIWKTGDNMSSTW